MITVKISVEQHVAEYIRGKYYDHEAGAVRFPSALDIYILIYDLLKKRPTGCPVDSGNLEFALPEGARVKTRNITTTYRIERRRFSVINCADDVGELHDFMDENKHINGVQFKDSVFLFMSKYGIEGITEDAC